MILTPITNINDLKKILSQLPDDMPLVTYANNHYSAERISISIVDTYQYGRTVPCLLIGNMHENTYQPYKGCSNEPGTLPVRIRLE